MNRQYDIDAEAQEQWDQYVSYLQQLSDSDLRFLCERSCPLFIADGSREQYIQLLLRADTGEQIVAQATEEQLSLMTGLGNFEGEANFEALLLTARWGSEADAQAHENVKAASKLRVPVSETELEEVLRRASQAGVVWEQPAGVWHLNPLLAKFGPADPAYPVRILELLTTPREWLVETMLSLGALPETVVAEELSEKDLVGYLRSFLCAPDRVRAVVSLAPAPIRRELEWFAKFGVDGEMSSWSPLRAEAVDWACAHLLGREFLDPVRSEMADDEVVTASLLGPVAMALKGEGWWLPREHEREPLPALCEPELLDDQAAAAVSVAGAYMDMAHGFAFGDANPGFSMDLHPEGYTAESFADALWLHDFAHLIGADPLKTARVVDMLLCAGMIDYESGLPTAASLTQWFSAGPGQRWAVLAAGWLSPRPAEAPPLLILSGQQSPQLRELLDYGLSRAARDLVVLACELEPTERYFGCCVFSYLQYRWAGLSALVDCNPELLFTNLLEGAEDLGLLYKGQTTWTAPAIATALHDAWLTRQDLDVEEVARLIAEQSAGQVLAAQAVQVMQADETFPVETRLIVSMRGVPSPQVAMGLDNIGMRNVTGAENEWVITDTTISDALLAVNGDPELIFSQLGPLMTRQMKVVLLSAMTHAAQLRRFYESATLPVAVPETQYAASDEGVDNGHRPDSDDGPDGESPVQLSLF